MRFALTLFCALLVALCGAALLATAETASEAAFREGMAALQSERNAEAAGLFERAAKLDPGDPRPLLGLAQARRAGGNNAGAAAAMEHLTQAFALSPVAAHGAAMYYAEGGDFERAAELEARSLELQPGDAGAYLRTASWYLQSGHADLAAAFARKGLEQGQGAALYDVLGKALAEQREIDGAEAALRAAIELQPYDEELRYNLGYLFLHNGDYDRAVAAFEEARRTFDKSPRIELGIGVARYAQRRFGEAIEAFLRVSWLAPGFEQPHYFLGAALEHAADRLPEVRARLQAFAEARPEHYLGPFLEAKGALAAAGPRPQPGALEEAASLLRTSIERRPEFWESHFELGVVHERAGRYAEARASLERAVELSPTSTTPRYRLARVLTRLGDETAAREQQAIHDRLVSEQRSNLLGEIETGVSAAPAGP